MKKFLNDLEKITSINTQLQNKLGEITILINNSNNLFSLSNSETKKFILLLQSFLCHKYYLEFMKVKSNENSTYDNCMNLILIILAKMCKINTLNGEYMINYFIEHINKHLECFNYIISFYRLYITSSQLKQCGKSEELYNYLFKLYKQLYSLDIEYEQKNNIKDIKSIFKSGIIKNINNSMKSQNYLADSPMQLTDRPINKVLNNDNGCNNLGLNNLNINNNFNNNVSDNCSINNININSNSIGEIFYQNDQGLNHNKSSNETKTGLSHIINSNSKTNILSRTDRKSNNPPNNNRPTSDLNNYSSNLLNFAINNSNITNNNKAKSHINSTNNTDDKAIQNKILKPKIPTLKFPLDLSLIHI